MEGMQQQTAEGAGSQALWNSKHSNQACKAQKKCGANNMQPVPQGGREEIMGDHMHSAARAPGGPPGHTSPLYRFSDRRS